MYDLDLHRTEQILKKRNKWGLLKDKEIYLFGVSDNTRQIIQILRELGVEPRNVIDNDITKQGSYCSRLKVISFDEIEESDDKKKLYIIYSAYWREMLPQLTERGIRKKNIWRLNRKSGLLLSLLIKTYLGKIFYIELKEKYGDVPIFVCPYTGTGDIYLIGTFWEEYINKNNINDYVFVVISNACKKVANLFDIKNIEVVKKKEYVSYLIDYYLYDSEKGKIKILNDCWAQVHTNQVEWFRGYKGLYFTDLFRRFVFDLQDDICPRHPTFKDVSEKVEIIFKEYGLIAKKTVILSPYSNTLSDLPIEFWENLVVQLVKKGYVVATNSGGKTEPAIKGTIGIFFALDIAPQIIEEAGHFVGIRSGFCDVISGTKAKKVILYDKGNRFYMGSAYEYFNLKGMQLCDDAIEIEYEHTNINDVVSEISNYF